MKAAAPTALPCGESVALIRAYVEGDLPGADAAPLQRHLDTCPRCRQELEARRHVLAVLGRAYDSKKISPDFSDTTNRRLAVLRKTPTALAPLAGVAARGFEGASNEEDAGDGAFFSPRESAAPKAGGFHLLGAAPWWAVSVALHVLVVILLGLITMTIGTLEDEQAVVVLTSLEKLRVTPLAQEQAVRPEARDIAAALKQTPATDEASTVASNIVVPPDILAQAELGDHFETINPDRPDTQSAFGNPEARMFHSASGNDEPEGGGGMGGTALLDDLIGVGGASSPGTGGGWGGGNGTGSGIGNGSGRGSFGQRNGGGRRLMVMRHGGNPATESAVDKALEWLARHQEPDGRWDYLKHDPSAHDQKTPAGLGDAGMTGLAVLAFLGAGHSERIGKYRDHVKLGVAWLIKGLGDGNRWGKQQASNYAQGIAAMALCEAAAMGRDPTTRKAAQQAADGVTEGQIKTGPSEYQAWDYAPSGQTNDTSVTGWNIMALKSAKVAGLKVDMPSFEGALNWIEHAQDLDNAPKGPDAEYWEGGIVSYRGKLSEPRTRGWISVTAIGAVTRLFVGGAKPDHPGVAGPCNLMLKPQNSPTNQKHNDFYYWYYATLAMFQKGGEHWQAWNTGLKKKLLETQRKDGDFDGSWNPTAAEVNGIQYGGRVMSTALGAMCLEVYYRYLPMFR